MVHYLWEEVLQTDKLLEIIDNYVTLETTGTKSDKAGKSSSSKMNKLANKTPYLPPISPVRRGAQTAIAQRRAWSRAQLSYYALGRFGQIELYCVVGSSANKGVRQKRRTTI